MRYSNKRDWRSPVSIIAEDLSHILYFHDEMLKNNRKTFAAGTAVITALTFFLPSAALAMATLYKAGGISKMGKMSLTTFNLLSYVPMLAGLSYLTALFNKSQNRF